MSQIIDRRANGKNKSAANRRRFIKRFKRQIKEAVTDALAKRSIKDIETGEQIVIPTEDISEPVIHHGQGGKREVIHPGNQEFVTGDQIQRPPQGADQSNQASDSGEGTDNFIFQLSKDEFLEIYFEELELPDLVKKQLGDTKSFKYRRAGYATAGIPANINIIRSLRGALARRLALSNPYRNKLKVAEEHLAGLEAKKSSEENKKKIKNLEKDIKILKEKIAAVPFIDTFDLRYNNRIQEPKPTTQAVVFCIMDVSGSMDESKKDIAKRFFILLYLFLTRNYEKIDVVFIRHHTSAKEVNEKEFFYSRETGGTVVSSAFELMDEIITKRYSPNEWNIYAAQASDGDNWNADSPYCQKLLSQKILPVLQYFAYVEIMPRYHQSLWQAYLKLNEDHPNFAMQHIDEASDIYPVFRELFKRQTA